MSKSRRNSITKLSRHVHPKEVFYEKESQFLYALSAYLRFGNAASFFAWRTVFAPFSDLVNARRIARVFFCHKSSGVYFAPAYASRNEFNCL